MSPICSPAPIAPAGRNEQIRYVRLAQIRLLYENANTGFVVTIIAAPILAYFQSAVIEHRIAVAWLFYMLVITSARFALSQHWRDAIHDADVSKWSVFFAIGAGLAGTGWGAAGILLYPNADVMRQTFLVFVLGGMMLGGASLLAARPEAFLAFLLPTGILPSVRFISESDKEHVTMGLLAILFTCATVITTWRFYQTVESSINLQFQNHDLVRDLEIAKSQTEVLNQELEVRIQERTAELHSSTIRLRDEIKQREQMEDELLRVRNLESLGVLAGGIAHDFNNFLTIVQGNIELARMQLEPDAPVLAILEDSATACRRAAFLSSQLLTFAKGGAPIRRVTSVGKLVLDAVHLARAGSSIGIAINIADDLWSAEVDAGQIGQVLHNILLNAKQAMAEGGAIEVRVENRIIGADQEPGSRAYVRVSIRDNGPGIPAEALPRIFDPYFTTKRTGSGLGLATAYAIVAKHGGHIAVESKPGIGTEFILDLPASNESPEPESPTGAAVSSGAGRLLVMDDEEALRTLLNRGLTAMGYEVQSARDGAEAIAMYQAAKASGRAFDAVLLDITISGGMGGIETAAKLKELDPAAKLVVSSGYSDASVMSKFREYGFDDVIPKPWRTAEVSEVFRRVLLQHANRRPG
jgi:signal transduction histidine kinase/ActR/RegA family two-component response regulator